MLRGAYGASDFLIIKRKIKNFAFNGMFLSKIFLTKLSGVFKSPCDFLYSNTLIALESMYNSIFSIETSFNILYVKIKAICFQNYNTIIKSSKKLYQFVIICFFNIIKSI